MKSQLSSTKIDIKETCKYENNAGGEGKKKKKTMLLFSLYFFFFIYFYWLEANYFTIL